MQDLASLLLPNITKTISDYENIYIKRNLGENNIVCRFAPSPTGFVHMGSLYSSFVNNIFAKQTDGVFFLRIEDTDKKREVENGIEGIINDLRYFEFNLSEGPQIGGDYGPYIQSERMEIYQAFAKHLIEQNLAYPCFCTEQELEEIRKNQKDHIGYYGEYAVCRNLSEEKIREKIANGEKYIIRLKSPGNAENKVVINDLIKGDITFPENDMDIVIIKSDGLPTYHFAHLVDDYLMGTTHVIRGGEWLSSAPIHLQLFSVFGFKTPNYCHLAPIEKDDNGSRRKLSKRKDPECSMQYYFERGIPKESILLYLATIVNPNFEQWYLENQDKFVYDYKFEFSAMPVSGALFDIVKLENLSKLYISKMEADYVYEIALKYAQEYDKSFFALLEKYKDFSIKMLSIDRYNPNPRKDIGCMADIKPYYSYMYDELFDLNAEEYTQAKICDYDIMTDYIDNYYNENDDKNTWFAKLKEVGEKYGYASDRKAFKKEPEKFKGQVGDVCELIRIAVTRRDKSPDLYDICKLLGKDRLKIRILKYLTYVRAMKG